VRAVSDLAGERFWEQFWDEQPGRLFVGLSHYQYRLGQLFAPYVKDGSQVCEIGCGGSIWLPQLAKRGAAVWGIDYSPLGLKLARANLERAGVNGTLIQADLRAPDALPSDAFDVIFSVGVIEHFDDPVTVLRTVASSLLPGGVLITLVPNLAGWWGAVQQRIDSDILAVHTIYTPSDLDAVHMRAGLTAREPARYFGGFCPLPVSYSRMLRRMPNLVKASYIRAVWLTQQLTAWTLSALGAADSPSYSGSVVGVYWRSPARDGHAEAHR
jgi:SAM-dependent methyltransferase